MGEQDSYREMFALSVVNTKVWGRDHRGEFRIGGRVQVKLKNTMGEVGSLQVCKQGCNTVKGIDNKEVSRLAWPEYQTL